MPILDGNKSRWDEALDMTASAMRRIAQESGPEAVAFSLSSPSTTAISDSNAWIRRLMLAFGSPNSANNIEQCGWGRGYATRYTFGVATCRTRRRSRCHAGHRE